MSRFSVTITGRGKFGHYSCFEEFGTAMARSLRDLGHYVTRDFEYLEAEGPGRIITFGSNNLREVAHGPQDTNANMPADMIIYNSEQLSAVANPSTLMWAHDQFRSRVVWDYSQANIVALKSLGIERAVHCPVSYHPSMSNIASVVDEDIDVLFYGSRDKWRNTVINAIEDAGLKVVRLFGVYGAERDKAIARSKIVLNLHFYKGGVFEIFRCSHLFANKKCVVSEGGGRDVGLEALARETTRYLPRQVPAFVEACRELVADAKLRREQAERGYEVFKRVLLVDSVQKALEQS